MAKSDESDHSDSDSSSSSSSSKSSKKSKSSSSSNSSANNRNAFDGSGPELTFEKIIEDIKERKFDHIIFMVGAGISTSAGIPDFRSPDTGLFHQLEKYNLPYPEAVFEISFFKSNPKPFFHLARQLFPENYRPTPCHYFMKLVHDKKQLLRVYTQNIDALERIAGVPDDKLVEAHGSFYHGHCINRECRKSYSLDWMKRIVLDEEREDNVLYCDACGSYVKPDIVFYGENLPERFYSLCKQDFINCDLLIIMGTSLTVQPFSSLISMVRSSVPRLMINKTSPEGMDQYEEYLKKSNRDVFVKSETDRACFELADKLGWRDELDKLISEQKKDSN